MVELLTEVMRDKDLKAGERLKAAQELMRLGVIEPPPVLNEDTAGARKALKPGSAEFSRLLAAAAQLREKAAELEVQAAPAQLDAGADEGEDADHHDR